MKNVDKYKTAQERAEAFAKFCEIQIFCSECPLGECHERNTNGCRFAWLDLEAEEEKPEPCPFCGHEENTFVYTLGNEHYVECEKCGYKSSIHKSREEAISSHNRVAKKCSSELLNKAEHAIEQFERTHDGDVSIVTETDADEDSLVIRIFGGKK